MQESKLCVLLIQAVFLGGQELLSSVTAKAKLFKCGIYKEDSSSRARLSDSIAMRWRSTALQSFNTMRDLALTEIGLCSSCASLTCSIIIEACSSVSTSGARLLRSSPHCNRGFASLHLQPWVAESELCESDWPDMSRKLIASSAPKPPSQILLPKTEAIKNPTIKFLHQYSGLWRCLMGSHLSQTCVGLSFQFLS